MNPLSFEEIIELHDESIRLHGGSFGILNEHAIRSAVEMPFSGFGDHEAYPSIAEKSAILCFSLVQGHGFRDGNKRVGLLALVVFLARNGYLFDAPEKEAEDFILELASGKKDKTDLVEWIEGHVVAVPAEPVVGELSYGGDLVLSEKAQQIEVEKPPHWTAKLFVQVLSDEIEKSVAIRNEHKKGGSSLPKVVFLDHHELFRAIGAQANASLIEVSGQASIINFLGNEISPSTREHTQNSRVGLELDLAVELGAIYQQLIEKSLYFRRIDMPEEYHPLLNAWAEYFTNYIENIESLPRRYKDEIQKAESLESNDDEPYRITMTIDATPKDLGALSREFNLLCVKLGIKDEKGFSAMERVDKALAALIKILARQAKAMENHISKCESLYSDLKRVNETKGQSSAGKKANVQSSLIQRHLSLEKNLRATLTELKPALKVCEECAGLVRNVVDFGSEQVAERVDGRVRDLIAIRHTLEEAQSIVPPQKAYLKDTAQIHPKLAASTQGLSSAYDEYDMILKRFSLSVTTQMESLEERLR